MAILGTELNSNLSTKGKTENTLDSQRDSKLHNLSSLTGQGLDVTKVPSQLDLEGKTPAKYVDNLPR
jgi:hypothetical protein